MCTQLLKPFIRMCSCMVGLLVIICNWASYAAILIRQILWNMGLWPFSNYSWILFRHFKQKVIICERPQTVYFWCSSLTFARGSNQPFISNAIVFLSSSRADIFKLFNFENTVEGIPLLIQWNLCDPTPEFSDILWLSTRISGPKIFL